MGPQLLLCTQFLASLPPSNLFLGGDRGDRIVLLLCHAKGATVGLMTLKLCPNPVGFGEEFRTRIRVCAEPAVFNLASGGLLMSFLRLSNCDPLWNEEC